MQAAAYQHDMLRAWHTNGTFKRMLKLDTPVFPFRPRFLLSRVAALDPCSVMELDSACEDAAIVNKPGRLAVTENTWVTTFTLPPEAFPTQVMSAATRSLFF